MPEAVQAVTPSAPPAALPESVESTEAATPPAGETPVKPAGDKTPSPAGETPDKAADEKSERARHRRQLSTAYRQAAEAKARAELAERQLGEARARATPAEDPGAPKLEQFKDIEEYAAAKAKYESGKALREHQTKAQTETARAAEERLQAAWEEKAARADGKYEDFDEVVGALKPTTPALAGIMHADNGEDVAYHIAKNPKEAQRIAGLPPIQQLLEIGKLSAKLAAEPPKPKTPSKAPAPITPVSGAAPVVSDAPSENDDYPDWFKKRNKQVHANRFVRGKPS